jgi:hypothetical protein
MSPVRNSFCLGELGGLTFGHCISKSSIMFAATSSDVTKSWSLPLYQREERFRYPLSSCQDIVSRHVGAI